MAPCGPQCLTNHTAGWALLQLSNRSKTEREKMGEEEHVSGSSVSHLWWDSKVFPSIHSCTSKQVPVSLFHFAIGYEPPGRLWDPPGARREDSVPVGAPCFPPHVHGPGHRDGVFSMGLQHQLKIATVVHEDKSNGTPLLYILKGVQSPNWSMSSQNFYHVIFDQSLNFLSWLKFQTLIN